LGYFGQPHIIVRFMAIHDVRALKTARRIGMSWMIVSLLGAMMTGLFGYAYVLKTGAVLTDPETIFLYLSQVLFHPVISGFLLAAILAAIMSTISSQLLVTSSSLTGDFYQAFLRRNATQNELVLVGRLSVLLIALLAIAFAYNRDSTILTLVSNAWAGFGAAFGPVILLSLYWKAMNKEGAICGMLMGALTVLVWTYAPFTIQGQSMPDLMYAIVPGFIMCSLTIFLVSKVTQAPNPSILKVFANVEQAIAESK
jgi:SSS family solute:Na+ symporter